MAQPLDVGTNFRGAEVLVVAIEVEAVGVLPRCAQETSWIEQGADKPNGAVIEGTGFEQGQEGEGRGGFVAVDTGREVNPRPGARRAFRESEEGCAGVLAETVKTEACSAGGRLEAGDEGGRIEGRLLHWRSERYGTNWLRGENRCCRIVGFHL